VLENTIDLINQVKTEKQITVLTAMRLTLVVSSRQATARDCWSRKRVPWCKGPRRKGQEPLPVGRCNAFPQVDAECFYLVRSSGFRTQREWDSMGT